MKKNQSSPFNLPGQTGFYAGKVRDVYFIGSEFLVMVVSNRISAFDVVLPRPIPYKGQVLNQIAARFLDATTDILPNWKTKAWSNVTIGHRCETFEVEMVIRGTLTGHAWREYKAGKRTLCGVSMPDGLKENDYFPSGPIITPTTKAHEGHDEDISAEEIINSGLVSREDYEQLEKYTYALFERGCKIANERGLILADTKYEFGKKDGQIYLIDEVHTPDSSRYFYLDGFDERQNKGEAQRQLSKEFVREWLMENGFSGQEGQAIPEMTDDIVENISARYIELYEKVMGEPFVSMDEDAIALQAEIITTLKGTAVEA